MSPSPQIFILKIIIIIVVIDITTNNTLITITATKELRWSRGEDTRPGSTINKEPIERVSHIQFLGVIVDNNLSWVYHIKEITSNMAKSTYQLARNKNFIDERCRKTFYHAYIHNKLEYGILLFGGAAAHQLRPLKSLQKRAVKLVVKNSSTNVFKAACVLPLKDLTDFQRS